MTAEDLEKETDMLGFTKTKKTFLPLPNREK
jgi:hypothetical protein